MEAGRSVRFVHDLSAGSVHPGSVAQVIPGAGMIHPSMGALLAGFGMAPTGLFLPGSFPAPATVHGAGSNLPPNVWNRLPVMAGQPGTGGGGNGERAAQQQPQRGPWTAEEDDILKRMVTEHGERKWAVVAQFLPGRIGKQCRERWTNHLRPDIKKSIWTEEDDLELIEAHKVYGNRWSMIAKHLPGRSENMVKNHWNATRRSLKAKRRLKKKKNGQEVAPGPSSVLEDYIRGLYPDAADIASPPPPSSEGLFDPAAGTGMMYHSSGAGSSSVSPPSSAGLFDPAAGMGMTMYHNSGSSSVSPLSSNVGAAMGNLTLPPPMLLDLNAYYGEVPAPLHSINPQVMMDHHHHQQQQEEASAYANLMTGYPFVDNLMWQQPSSTVHAAGDANIANYNAGHPQYYYGGDLSGGGSSSADDVDVVQMASREFLMPSQEEATLDLARFM